MTARELSRLHVALFGATALASALACLLTSRLIVNRTPSLPLGLYWLSHGEAPAPGTLVAFPVPAGVRDVVRERGYLPPGAFLVKPVVAMPRDLVCAEDRVLTVNSEVIGPILTADSAGRALPHYDGCGPLPEGRLFVASHYDKSFDSRTFGPIAASDVRGKVTPLWTF
jgi:conjugative transfer signal peptidase TraF